VIKPQRIENRELLNSYHQKRCVACGKQGSDPAHVLSRGAGGDDVESNLIALCRRHHSLQHQVGWYYLVVKCPSVATALKLKGWTFNGRVLERS
jgi:hypothetical protein